MIVEEDLEWLSIVEAELTNLERRLAASDAQEIDLNQIDPKNYTASLNDAVLKARGPDYPLLLSEIGHELDNALSKYLASSFQVRQRINALFDDIHHLLSYMAMFPSHVSRKIQDSEDTKWLDLGLAAALIENGRTDFRYLWISLAELYEKARTVGIEPLPHFREIGRLASNDRRDFDLAYSGNNILSEFLASEFKESLDK